MAINTLEYSKIFQTELDQQVVNESTTGWMEDNAGQVIYNGGNEVKIPTISMQGMADYSREEGYVQGTVNLSYQTMIMTQDRGRKFTLDAMDVDETNFVVNAGTVSGEFQTKKVIPEIDSYRYSKIFALAKAKNKAIEGYTPTKQTILEKLLADIRAIRDIFTAAELVIVMSPITAGILDDALEGSRRMSDTDFKQGNVTTKVKSIDHMPILEAPSSRLKTIYKKNDGKTAGQKEGGLVPDTSAKNINWIICPKKAPIAVSKQDKVRIFTPEENQAANAWQIDYRRYHDLWIPEQRLELFRVCSN